jgi:hypothetical protein
MEKIHTLQGEREVVVVQAGYDRYGRLADEHG